MRFGLLQRNPCAPTATRDDVQARASRTSGWTDRRPPWPIHRPASHCPGATGTSIALISVGPPSSVTGDSAMGPDPRASQRLSCVRDVGRRIRESQKADTRLDGRVKYMTQPTPPTVLVVEDDADLRATIVESLEANGFAVAQAADAADAIDRLHGFAYDCLVVDLKLPDADGMTVLSEALTRYPGIRAVVMTGFGGVGEAVEAIRRRRGGLPDQAVPAVTAGAGAEGRDGAATAAGGKRRAEGATPRQVPLRQRGRAPQRRAGALRDAGTRGADEQHRADPRRDGDGQGVDCPHDSPQQPPRRPTLRGVQRGRHSRAAGRGRALRPREGGLHGCHRQSTGPVRAGPSRHAVHRRGGGDVAAAAGEAAARAAGTRGGASWRPEPGEGGYPRDRRDPHGSQGAGPRRHVPRGPVLSAQRHTRAPAATTQPARGHSAAGRSTS